jgi:antagonist of KipI
VNRVSILRGGMFTTVQDLGRWHFQSRGVPVSGALDWYSHRMANLLVGNDRSMAGLEITLMGPHLQFEQSATVAVTGALFRLTIDDVEAGMNRAIHVEAGTIVKFGERVEGARAYLAVAGGIDVPSVLGSRSTHALTRMGGHHGRALKTGDVLPIAAVSATSHALIRNVVDSSSSLRPATGGATLRVITTDETRFGHIASTRFRVSPQSDRMGYRLEGGSIPDRPQGNLISIAVPTGAIQLPPTGQPILLMNDHATTGGYAIAATVITADLPLAGQLAPGDSVAFEACSLDTAAAELRRMEAALGA